MTRLTAVAAAAGVAMFEFTRRITANIDEITKQAKDLGLGVEALQEYRFAAGLAGVSSGDLDRALERLSRTLGDARTGNERAIDQFKELGLTADEIANLDTEQVLSRVADGLSEIDDTAERASKSYDLLGRAGLRVGNFLADGSEAVEDARAIARERGFIFTAEEAKQAEDFQDSLATLRSQFVGIANLIAARLAPSMQSISDAFQNLIVDNREMIETGIDNFINGAAASFNFLQHTIEVLEPVLRLIPPIFRGIVTALKLAYQAIKPFLGILNWLADILVFILDLATRLIDVLLGGAFRDIGKIVGGIGKAIGAVGSFFGLGGGDSDDANNMSEVDIARPNAVNNRQNDIDINIEVPPGTTEEQQDAIRGTMDSASKDLMRQLEQTESAFGDIE